MKKKPDLKLFKDPDNFLNGGAADIAEKNYTAKHKGKVSEKKLTQQKIFRLSIEVSNALKLHIAQSQANTGIRITETEIVEKLLREYLGLK
ncbi:MAG: hypothetical protein EKE20_16815 [Candidatus Symbiopectobacterium sp. Dall1.0]|nr:hypothetical protein [Candidatus Symbiopectobacterium sp. Dall1.0]